MDLNNLKSLFAEKGCNKIFVKKLSPNDNSKNQVYLGGSFEILNVFPLSSIKTESAGDWKRERFKASINFCWIGDDAVLYPAPQAQLILYPKYPEVRFSGFLNRCEKPPSELMTQRLADRLLFLSVGQNGIILGYLASPDSCIAKDFERVDILNEMGVFKVIELTETVDNRKKLLDELRRIHSLNWIISKRLNKNGDLLPCFSPNCGGYTLEAELGITPNGYSEPDFLGWEIKQFSVKRFESINSSVITLMTPEPTDGFYVTNGAEAFIRKYGYDDLGGKANRKNFGGLHKIGISHPRTNLKMELIGFDTDSGKIRSSEGRIVLLDNEENEAAAWSFASLLLHWNRKHNQACYVPSIMEKEPVRKYRFANRVLLGVGTDFQLFLSEMSNRNIYYDPGIKMEDISIAPKIKRRSQFRIKSGNLQNLYKSNELITL